MLPTIRTNNDPPQSRSRALRSAAVIVAILVGAQIVALALVVAGEIVPDHRVANALVQAIDKGWITETEHPHTGLDNRVDRWTECIALTIGLGDAEGASVLESAITSPDIGKCGLTVPALLAYRDGAPLVSTVDYFRYWHGYTFITRPSLGTLGVAGTRVLAMGLLLSVLVALAVIVGRDTSPLAATLLIAPAVLSTDFVDLGESVPHALAAAATWAGALIAWLLMRRTPTVLVAMVGGVVAGSLSVFIDLMVFFPGSWALATLMVLVAAYVHGWRRRRLLAAGAAAFTGWLIGFVVTWASKWVIAGLTVGFGTMIDSVSRQVSFRIAGEHSSVTDGLGAAAIKNVGYWLQRPLGGIVVGLAVLLAGILVFRGLRSGTMSLWSVLVLAAPAGIPLVWYELLSNHTQIHFWITYKSLALAAGGFLFGLYVASGTTGTGPTSEEPQERRSPEGLWEGKAVATVDGH